MSGWESWDWSLEKVAAEGQHAWSLVQRQPELELALLAREVGNRPASVPRSTIAESALMSARNGEKFERLCLGTDGEFYTPR